MAPDAAPDGPDRRFFLVPLIQNTGLYPFERLSCRLRVRMRFKMALSWRRFRQGKGKGRNRNRQKKGNSEKSFNRPNGPLRRGSRRCGASSNLVGSLIGDIEFQFEAEFIGQYRQSDRLVEQQTQFQLFERNRPRRPGYYGQ